MISAPRLAEEQNGLERAVAEIIDAEHTGDVRQAKRLGEVLSADGEHQGEDVSAVLERARRDQKRLVALGLIDPPYRNWRQRVIEAIRGTPATTAY